MSELGWATVQCCHRYIRWQGELVLSNLCIKGDTTMKKIVQFTKDESGATAIEYGLIAAGIAVAIIGAVFAVGGKLSAMFQGVAGNLNAPAA